MKTTFETSLFNSDEREFDCKVSFGWQPEGASLKEGEPIDLQVTVNANGDIPWFPTWLEIVLTLDLRRQAEEAVKTWIEAELIRREEERAEALQEGS